MGWDNLWKYIIIDFYVIIINIYDNFNSYLLLFNIIIEKK